MLRLEREARARGHRVVAGVDEAGRGPLAGPVFACAVVLPDFGPDGPAPESLTGLTDSKKLAPPARREFARRLRALPGVHIGTGACTPWEIDTLNILQASLMAMARAVAALTVSPDLVMVDGNRIPDGLPCASRAVVGGDGLSLSIAAASVLAKTLQEDEMDRLHAEFPAYGFARHRGYGTAEHLAALRARGPTPHHRFSFRPVRAPELW